MKEYSVSTQHEYDRALEIISLLQKRPLYDIECSKGTELVEEVNALMYHYIYEDKDKDRVYDGLSFFNFDQSQADDIMRHFQEHPPRDMFDIERGLNLLHIIPHDYEEDQPADNPKIVIKDSKEKIIVRSNVEVYGRSFVEAFDSARIIAKHNAYVIAHDSVSVEAYHRSRIDAYDHSQIRAFNKALVTASGTSRVEAFHTSCVTAGETAEVSARHNAYTISTDNANVTAYDKAIVDARGSSIVTSYNTSHIIAWDTSAVSAHDQSFIHASDKANIEAHNQSYVLARKNARVTGSDDSLILTRNNARSETSGNSSSIAEQENNAENLRKNMLTVMHHPRFAKDPIFAMQVLMQAVPEEQRAAIHQKLRSMGCTDKARTKAVLNRWMKTHGEEISYER
jgi:hypothetical protein